MQIKTLNIFKITIATISVIAGISIIGIGLGSALIPLIAAAILAYLFFPFIRHLERLHIKRQYTMLMLFIVIALLIVWGLLILIPSIIAEIQIFITLLPSTLGRALVRLADLAKQYGIDWQFDKNTLPELIKTHLNSSSLKVALSVAVTLKNALTNVLGSLLTVLNIFLFPLFFFFIVGDYESIVQTTKSLVPMRFLPKIQRFIRKLDMVLSGYIRGQLMVLFTLALLYSVSLGILGIPFGFLIGAVTGFICIIPYVGVFLGFSTALIVAIATSSDLWQIIGVVGIFSVMQVLESFFITPRLVGDRVGLTPLLTILVLFIGGNLLGFWGMLFAIPLAGIAKLIVVDLVEIYKKSDFYKGKKLS